MNILAFSDFHNGIIQGESQYQNAVYTRFSRLLEPYDAVISAGDHSWFGRIHPEFWRVLNEYKGAIYYVLGNHENRIGDQFRTNLPRAVDLSLDPVESGGVCFYGWDSFVDLNPAEENEEKKRIMDFARKTECRSRVFVSHVPPVEYVVDDRVDPGTDPVVSEIIADTEPDLVICGHIHAYKPVTLQHRNTWILNPGPFGARIGIDDQGTVDLSNLTVLEKS